MENAVGRVLFPCLEGSRQGSSGLEARLVGTDEREESPCTEQRAGRGSKSLSRGGLNILDCREAGGGAALGVALGVTRGMARSVNISMVEPKVASSRPYSPDPGESMNASGHSLFARGQACRQMHAQCARFDPRSPHVLVFDIVRSPHRQPHRSHLPLWPHWQHLPHLPHLPRWSLPHWPHWPH